MFASSATSGQLYAYGHGRVGVLQEYLLTQGDVDRMVTARDTTDLARIIAELKISTQVEYISNPHRFINNIEKWLRHELRSMVSEEEAQIFDILWMKDDAALLAYLLKKHLGLTSDISTEPHVGATAYDPEDLKALVQGIDVPSAPRELRTFIGTIRGNHALSPQSIDTRVAQYIVDVQLTLARKASANILLYVAHHIDLQNIRTARRLRKDERPEDHLVRGGEIDVSRFSLDRAKLASVVRGSSLGSVLADSIQSAEDSSIILERGLAKAIAFDIARMRSNALTIDPIFAFGAITQSQLKLLRTILIGKSAHLTAEELKKLLPPFLSTSAYAS